MTINLLEHAVACSLAPWSQASRLQHRGISSKCCGSAYCRLIFTMPGLLSSPICINQKCLQTLLNVPRVNRGEQKCPQLKNKTINSSTWWTLGEGFPFFKVMPLTQKAFQTWNKFGLRAKATLQVTAPNQHTAHNLSTAWPHWLVQSRV